MSDNFSADLGVLFVIFVSEFAHLHVVGIDEVFPLIGVVERRGIIINDLAHQNHHEHGFWNSYLASESWKVLISTILLERCKL